MRRLLILIIFLFAIDMQATPQEGFRSGFIFDLQNEHTHGSTIVELPNGDLLAAWFQGSGERWADDVRIMGARLHKGEEQWSNPFVMADVPGFPDVNPVLFLDRQNKLWLVWYTVLANLWETSLPKYRISENYMQSEGPPEWKWQEVLHVKPGDSTERGIQPDDRFVKAIERKIKEYGNYLTYQGASDQTVQLWYKWGEHILARARGDDLKSKGKLYHKDGTATNQEMGFPLWRRIGWQTKNKAVFVGNRLLLPLYSDGFDFSLMAITDDGGATWKFSEPLVGPGNIQPTIAFKKDGTLVAFMRDNGPPPKRHMISYSTDNGMTWSMVKDGQLPNEGSGSDIVTLKNGHWVLAFNDTEDGRYTLAVTISTDEGKTWPYLRHLEQDLRPEKEKRLSASYPAIIQGADGTIHIVYSYHQNDPRGSTIKYARFPESWIMQGDQ